jgi:hypothetical protein
LGYNRIESHPEVDDVIYRSGVHKMIMVRMPLMADEFANVRFYIGTISKGVGTSNEVVSVVK